MRLIRARIHGFQSFGDTGEIGFSEGINLVIGQNNSGKSALLRALLPALPDDRHRTPEKWEQFKLPPPEVTLTFEANGTEFIQWILRSNSQQIIPTPHPGSVDKFIHYLFERTNIIVSVVNRSGYGIFAEYPSHHLFVEGQSRTAAAITPNNGDLHIQGTNNVGDSLPGLLWSAWQHEMFYFAAERMTIGEAPGGRAERLRPDAGNLPNVLHTLSGERGDVFRRLVGHIREIFSTTIGNLSVRTSPNNNSLEVRVWPTKSMERVELSFPLNSSGTGVAQVLALLTAIMTIDKAIFIIDEINTFLHSAAIKALLRILQTQYMQHQYIISTHAADVINFSNPNTIHIVKRDGYESWVRPLDLTDVGEFREVAAHLGVSMADVFAAERVIWVEGPTEELCFPFLYQNLIGPLEPGTIFTSVASTGDFNSKRRDRAIVYEVYRRLSAAATPLVVSVAFSFDTETLADRDKDEMRRDARGLLHFLPRRHFECYLVDPVAISAFIISKDDPGSGGSVTPGVVEEALKAAAAERPLCIPEWRGDITDPSWLARVDAANLIINVCGTVSDQRVRFAKKDDSLFLLRHILENDQRRLAPLADYLKCLVAAISTGGRRQN